MGPEEQELCEALEDWREEKTHEIHGESHLIDIGPSIIMPDGVLDRILACAHYLKIRSIEDLRQETHWSKTNQFGIEVISLIHHIIPIPVTSALLTTTPLQPRSIPQISTSLPDTLLANSSTSQLLPVVEASTRDRQREANLPSKRKKCSACGLEGHNCSSSLRYCTLADLDSLLLQVVIG